MLTWALGTWAPTETRHGAEPVLFPSAAPALLASFPAGPALFQDPSLPTFPWAGRPWGHPPMQQARLRVSP